MMFRKRTAMTLKVLIVMVLLPCDEAQTRTYNTADCEDLAKCMTHLGDHMNDAIVDLTHYTKESMTRFYDTICGDVDDLVKCYEPKTFEGCSSLQPFIQYVPSQVELRKQFDDMCAEREELVSAVECFVQDSVGIPLQRCTMTMISHIHLATIDGESHTMHSCLALSAYRACVLGVIDGKCDQKTLKYIQSSKSEQYYMVCSSPKLIVNVCFISIIYFINKVIL